MSDSRQDIIDFLNLMLECERAGAKALRTFQSQDPPPPLAAALPGLTGDEARYCAGLTGHIKRLGGTPSRRTGDFLATILGTEGWPARLDLLVRGQNWVAKRIAERLGQIDDGELVAFLTEMHATHVVNVDAARAIARDLP